MNWPALRDNDVHVWEAKLEGRAVATPGIETLSVAERQRAAQYKLQQDRDRFIQCRNILRILLGRYLDEEPSRLEFSYLQNGKPTLDGICFNLSHSEGMALFGFSLHRRIGIDIELLRPVPDQATIVESFFSPAEKAYFYSLDPSQQDEGFLTLWTQKEAYLKARGDGFGHSIQCLDKTQAWTTRRILSHSNYIAALTVEGRDEHTSFFQWRPKEVLV